MPQFTPTPRSQIRRVRKRGTDDRAAKLEAWRAFTEHIVPGRWDTIRQPSP